ncbi:unnamed protein product [Prorocentrum cordatum]|uniref:Uncharacterized protein n=1 Tax=Prorocentrum cordatum TaxID=2364126 RepID=A0ABN9YBS1_9DINO|nr:unnamed protein product [Polarella glacialis]
MAALEPGSNACVREVRRGFLAWVTASLYVVLTSDYDIFIQQLDIASTDLRGLRFGPSGGGLPVGLAGGRVYRFTVAPAPAELVALLAEGDSAAIAARRASPAVPLPLPAPPAPPTPGATASHGAGGTRVLDVPGRSRVVGQEALPPAALDVGGRSAVTLAGEVCTVTRLEPNADIDAWARAGRAAVAGHGCAAPRTTPSLAGASLLVREPSVPIRLRGPPHDGRRGQRAAVAGTSTGVISKALELAVSDGLDLANLTSYGVPEPTPAAADPEKADFEGAHHVMGEDEVSSGALAAPSLREHVAAEFSREGAIDKERRKAKEAKKPGPKGAKEKD